MLGQMRRSGVAALGEVPWGTHFCQFYQAPQDLLEVLIGYFKQGLEDHELCLWVTSEPLGTEDAYRELAKVTPDLDERICRNQIEMLDYRDWYLTNGRFDAERVLRGWAAKEREALAHGYAGLRVGGNLSWLDENTWKAYTEFEATAREVISSRRLLAVCTYPLDRCTGADMLDILRNHPLALLRKQGQWEVVRSPHQWKMEESPQESEARRNAVLDTIPDPAWLKDKEGRFLAVNAAWYRFFGKDATNVSGKPAIEFFPSKMAAEFGEHDRGIMQSRHPLHCEELLVGKDGGLTWFETIESPLFNEHGEVIGTSGLARDITLRKRTEAILTAERDLACRLAAARDLDDVTRLCLDAAIANSGLECGGIYLVDPVSGRLQIARHIGLSREFVESVASVQPGSVQEHILQQGQSVVVSRDQMEKRGIPSAIREGLSVLVAIPVMFEQRAAACLNIASRTITAISPDTLSALVAVAAQMGVAIARAHAEMLLRESVARFRLIASNTPDHLVVQDCELRYSLVVNPQLGLTEQDMIGKTDYDILTKEDADGLAKVKRRVLDAGDSVHLETSLPSPTGKREYFDGCFVPKFDSHGQVDGLIGYFKNITGRKEAEEALRESETRFRSVIETSPDAIALLDLDGRFLLVNQRAVSLIGFRDAAEMLSSGINGFDLISPEDQPRARNNVHRLLGVGILPNVEYTLLRRDGSRNPSEVSASVLKDAEGDPCAMVLVVRDITERKQTEDLLRKSEDRYRSLFRGMTEGFALHEIICDEHNQPCDYRFLELNPAFEELTGLQRNKVIGKTLREILPNDVSPWIDIYGRVALTGQPARFDSHSVALQRHYEVYAYCPAPRQFAVLFTDITQRLQAEEERRQLDAQLQHTQKLESLGILAGGIAHDFNNLLAGIMGYADLALARLPLREPARADIEEIRDASQRAAGLTRQMLAYSGRGKFVVEPQSLTRIVEGSRNMLAMSVSKRALLQFHLAPDLPAIRADAAQMCQVVMNLVINASEALAEQDGMIGVSTYTQQFAAKDLAAMSGGTDLREGLYVCLEVTDTGCGMDKDTLAKIYDPFFTTKFTGRGLGLAAVHGIVRGHHGGLRVSSKPGQGTTFQVLFPASEDTLPLAPQEPASVHAWRGHGIVLVVDDEEIVRNVAKEMIELVGFSVLTAPDGAQAIQLYRRYQREVACVLLDLTMPTMNGEATFRELRRICPQVRVILSSGYSEEGATARFSTMDLAGFIQKPYQLDVLIALLQRVVGDGDDPRPLSSDTENESPRAPAIEPAPLPVKSDTADREPACRSGTVLVVDDEEMVRTSTKVMFELAGFSVVTANDGEEAIRKYRAHQDHISCVYLDLTMPKMDGEETLRALRRIDADVRVILASGYDERELAQRFAGLGVWEFFYKAQSLDNLIARLRAAMNEETGRRRWWTRDSSTS